MDKPLYDQDFVRWTEQQAAALRAAAGMRVNAPIDWENLAEEVESLGKSERRQLGSRILAIVEQLMKLQASPAEAPRRCWRATILGERGAIADLFDDSPGLRRTAAETIAYAIPRARRVVEEELAPHGEFGGEAGFARLHRGSGARRSAAGLTLQKRWVRGPIGEGNSA